MIYANGKIYVIISDRKKLYYIGSTTQTLTQRLATHNSDFKRFKLGKRGNVTSFDILACDDYQIKLIELCPCVNNKQLQKREGELIKTYKIDGFACVNKRVEGRTPREYYLEHKDSIVEYQKEYKATHKDSIAEYYLEHKDSIAEYKKDYYETHKDSIAENRKQYYETHKDSIAEYKKKYYAKKKSALAIEVVFNKDN